jgi:hypothetical protein
MPAARSGRMHLYCTLFDRNYLSRGLALYASLVRHRREFRLAVLCLDNATHGALEELALPGIELVTLSSLEDSDPELSRAKAQRSKVEYYFTCKPVLMKFLAAKHAEARKITYLDSDLFYFADPGILESAWADSAVALTPHRFPPRLSGRSQFGRFNAGWVGASCSGEGLRFIEWWRALCLQWCRLEVEANRFGDQKYLDEVPALFAGVTVFDQIGANLAPWNVGGQEIRPAAEGVCVEGNPLIFYHFHGLRKVLGRLYDSGLQGYEVALTAGLRKYVYRPYLDELSEGENRIRAVCRRTGLTISGTAPIAGLEALRKLKRAAQMIASGTWVIGP